MNDLQTVENYIDITTMMDSEAVYVCLDAERKEIARGTEADLEKLGFRLAGRSVQAVRVVV